jgi:hypothetical protein
VQAHRIGFDGAKDNARDQLGRAELVREFHCRVVAWCSTRAILIRRIPATILE